MKTIQFVILGGKNAEKRILSIKKKIVVLKKQFIYVHAMGIIIPMKIHGILSSHYMILMSHT